VWDPERIEEVSEILEDADLRDVLKERATEEFLFGQPPQYEIILAFNRLVKSVGARDFDKALELADDLQGALEVSAFSEDEGALTRIDRTFRTLRNVLRSDRAEESKSQVARKPLERIKEIIEGDLGIRITPLL